MSYPGQIEDDYLPGDELIPEPEVVTERRASLPAPPEPIPGDGGG